MTSLPTPDSFVLRHIGPPEADTKAMLAALGYPDALITRDRARQHPAGTAR